jgi:hypothetical protein
MLRGTDVMDMSGAMARENRHQQNQWFGPEGATHSTSDISTGAGMATVTVLLSHTPCYFRCLDLVWAPSYFTNISITTPIVSALKNYYI